MEPPKTYVFIVISQFVVVENKVRISDGLNDGVRLPKKEKKSFLQMHVFFYTSEDVAINMK